MSYLRKDGKYKIYIIKHLWKDDPTKDWSNSGSCTQWIPKEIVRTHHDELVYRGIFRSFTANGRCWQITGVHGSFIEEDAINILNVISKWNSDHRFKVCRLLIDQVTEDVAEKKYTKSVFDMPPSLSG